MIDENLPPFYAAQLAARLSDTIVTRVGTPNTVPTGTADPVLLRWCEANKFVLVTADRASMPDHVVRHLARGGHLPGVLLIRPRASAGEVLNAVELIATALVEDELVDSLLYIPLQKVLVCRSHRTNRD